MRYATVPRVRGIRGHSAGAVPGGGGGVAAAWLSDYRTALGISLPAVLDTAQALPWASASHNNDVGQLEVVTVSHPNGVTRALRTTPPLARSGWAEPDAINIPICAVGQSMFYRWHFDLRVPDALLDDDFHPIQCGPSAGSIEWAMYLATNFGGAGKYRMSFYVNATANAWPNYQWLGPTLDKAALYRPELQIERVTTMTFRMHAWISRWTGALWVQDHDDTSFVNSTGTATLASNPILNHQDPSRLALIQGGCNGAEAAACGVPFSDMAALAVSHQSRCLTYGTLDLEAA